MGEEGHARLTANCEIEGTVLLRSVLFGDVMSMISISMPRGLYECIPHGAEPHFSRILLINTVALESSLFRPSHLDISRSNYVLDSMLPRLDDNCRINSMCQTCIWRGVESHRRVGCSDKPRPPQSLNSSTLLIVRCLTIANKQSRHPGRQWHSGAPKEPSHSKASYRRCCHATRRQTNML